MQKNCTNCQQEFQITEHDQNFHKKISVPPPTFCHACRQQRKLLQINQMHLFKRKCDTTGEDMISNFPSDSPYKVYKQEHWFSDAVDNTQYGKEYDFNRPFFEQWHEVSQQVSRPALFTNFTQDENSAYTNYAGLNKNCYMIFDSDEDENCYYSYGLNSSKSTIDCYRCTKLELCYENIDSTNCYNCSYVTNSDNCAESIFLNNCIGVKNSIMCSNIKNKEYHVFNKPVSKEQFQEIKDSLKDHNTLESAIQRFNEFKLQFPQKFMIGVQNENVSGNYLVNCKNAIECYDSRHIWDGTRLTQIFMQAKDCMDCDEVGDVEICYESNNLGVNAYNILFCQQCLESISNLTYCVSCYHSSDLFGCVGLNRKKYCILNKQYTEEEYKALIPKIIEHMKFTKEYGEFFPAYTSCYPYNLTMAQEHYPLTKEEALKKGYTWRDDGNGESADDPGSDHRKSALTGSIDQTTSEVTKKILNCETCSKPYKIIEQELSLHKQIGIPLPRKCFLCRHKNRYAQRNKRVLYDRECQKCKSPIRTTYSPEQPEIVYCEPCYQENLS